MEVIFGCLKVLAALFSVWILLFVVELPPLLPVLLCVFLALLAHRCTIGFDSVKTSIQKLE